MKAIVVNQYGGPEVLKFEECPDPVPGSAEVLGPGRRHERESDGLQAARWIIEGFSSIQFPGIIGVDIAGTVVKIGPGVEGFSVGDQVFAMAADSYAELCVVKAAILAKVPEGLDLIQARRCLW